MATSKDLTPSRRRFRRLHVMCIEGDWSPRLGDTQSVQPLLKLLNDQGWISFRHQRVRSREDLLSDLGKVSRQAQYRDSELLFVAAHGSEGRVSVGRGVPLDDLYDLELKGRVLYLAGCSIARSRARKEFKDLRRETGARAVCGYTADVDWVESAAFELLLVSWLAYERTNWPYDALRATRDSYAGLAQRLGFAAVWRGGEIPRPARRELGRKP